MSTIDRTSVTHRLCALPMMLAVGALVRVVALLGFEGDIHDGLTRIGTAAEWLRHGTPFFGRTVWPEGNYWIPIAALSVWGDPYWSPRIAYALIGLSNVWLVYALANAVFGRRAAIVSGWIVAVLPYHVMVSTNSAMSEAPYISLMLGAILAVVRFRSRPSCSMAALAGVMLAAATSFRIDGLVWGLPLAASLLVFAVQNRIGARRTVTALAVFGGLGLAFAVALFLRWYQLYPNDPTHLLSEAKLNTQQFFVNGKHPRWPNSVYQTFVIVFWPLSLFVLLTPGVALLGFAGIARAVRDRVAATLPLILGMLTIWLWLSYAAYRHDILAQWRYALILALLLTAFVPSGVDLLVGNSRRISRTTVAAIVALLAIGTQAAVTVSTYRDSGSFTRQLSAISPIRPDQFSSRALLKWAENNLGTDQQLLVTPHAMEQAYLAMERGALEKSGRVVVQSYFLPHSQLVHTRSSLESELLQKLSVAQFVATSGSLRELGLRDGLTRELLQPTCAPDARAACEWKSVRLQKIEQFGTTTLWKVL